MYMAGVNCIYDDGTVISLDAGPCQDPSGDGAGLVDVDTQTESVEVTTPYPSDIPWGTLAAVGLGLMMIGGGRGKRVSKRRRRR